VSRGQALNRLAVSTLFSVNGFTYGVWVAHLPLLKARLELSDGALGIALLCAGVASLATLPLAGAWIARYGSRGITVTASLGAVMTLALPFLAPTYPLLLGATFAIGVAYSAMDVSMNAQAVVVERAAAKPIMSSFHGLFSTGGLAGSLATAALLAHGGTARGDTVLLALCSEAVLVIAVFALARDPTPAAHARDPSGRPRRRQLAGSVALLGILAFFGLVGEGSIADWSAIYLRTSLGADVATAAGAFGAFSVAMAAGRFAGDAIVARFGGPGTLAGGALLASAALSLALAAHTVWASYLGFAAVGLGLSNVIPVLFSLAGRMRGLGAGVGIAGVSTIGYAGFLVGPPAIGFTSDAIGLRLALGLVVLGIVAIALLAPHIRPTDRA